MYESITYMANIKRERERDTMLRMYLIYFFNIEEFHYMEKIHKKKR